MKRQTAARETNSMFLFLSNRPECFGSIMISLVASALLFLAIRGCGG